MKMTSDKQSGKVTNEILVGVVLVSLLTALFFLSKGG